MSSTALSHSVNSSGRMGLFVDPHACSCEGCHSYTHDTHVTEEPATERSDTQRSEPLRLSFSMGLGAAALPAVPLQRAPANHLWDGDSWVSVAGQTSVSSAEDEADEGLFDKLRSLRATLQIRQDAVYSGATRSHDEMAAQDAEWEELDNKIHAIENLLLAFGSIFRTR